MDPKSMTRKEFVTLTFTLIGGAATAAACSSSNNTNNGTGGTNGATGGGGASGATCTDPLPDTMIPDDTMHMHVLQVPAATLNGTTDQTVNTGPVIDATGTIAPHMHMVIFNTTDLGTLKGGGTVTVTTQAADGHTHMYRVSCTNGLTGTGGNGAAGASGSAGANGAAGSHGAAGANGAAGSHGAAGANGAAGSNGLTGGGGH